MLYLATLAQGRLRALFECALPFTCAEPYFTAAGLVPPESFFGRESERRAIMDRYGTCFVYGGRQLGKTALLHAAQSAFHAPESNRLALYVDLKVHDVGGIAHGADHIWQVLWSMFAELGITEPPMPRGRDRLVDKLEQSVCRWVERDNECRVLALLDEADGFLAGDLKNDFRASSRLKGMMDVTQRRFKVVFCGLHNVLRNTERANHPLAHLGEPVCVGPLLENGDLQQARALIRTPLAAVGYTFENDNLPTRILGWCNYYPSLIQLYGEALLRHVRDSHTGQFPRVITSGDVRAVSDRVHFRDFIRDRFSLTLQLDPRYEVITYAVAFELLGEDANLWSRGLDARRILDLAKEAWAEGFEIAEREFGTLLQEMCGLGVLRQRTEDGQPPLYVFRNANARLLLGDPENILEVLEKERELPDVDASAFHGQYAQGPAHSPRRGPLTFEQESLLKRGGRIAVLCGTCAANVHSVGEFLEQRMDKSLVRRLDPCMNENDLARQLSRLRPVQDTYISLLGDEDAWTLRWIERAADSLKKARRGDRLRVVFPADPDQLWRFVEDLPDDLLEDATNGTFDWISVKPWATAFVRHWATDQNLHEAQSRIDELRKITGGWPLLLEQYVRFRETTWKAKSAKLTEYVTENAHELLDSLGLADRRLRDEMAALRDCGKLTYEDVDMYETLLWEDGGHPFPQGVLRRRLFWAVQLGLVEDVGGALEINPLVAGFLPDAGA